MFKICHCPSSAFKWPHFRKGRFPSFYAVFPGKGVSHHRWDTLLPLTFGKEAGEFWDTHSAQILSPPSHPCQSMNAFSSCGKGKVARCSGDAVAEATWYFLCPWTAGSAMALGEERWLVSVQGTGFLSPWGQMSMLAFLQSVQQSVSKAAFEYPQPQQHFGMVGSDLT